MEKSPEREQRAAAGAEAPLEGRLPEGDARLLAQLRSGDVEAGQRFVRDHYPEIYRYLYSLTGHREAAEDLTQETFLQAWRHLDQFEGRAPLRLWLHAIARREFLRARGRPRRGAPFVPGSTAEQRVTSLEEVAELSEPRAAAWTDEAELRVLLERLPEEQREVLLLYSLEGYSSREIAEIVQAPASTVRHRLGLARAHLARALGPGDLAYLNEPSVPMRQWAWLPLDQMYALETRLVGRGPGARTEDEMERREFLRHAAVGAAGLMLPETEKEVVDDRLTQKATCAFKGTALSDLCAKLKSDTGIPITAGPSVADEKVTLFCEKTPLREVMRQLSRPFGYTWLRSGKPGEYKYELVQDLRSQLLEEELRNRDRNAALLDLQREIDRFRPYLELSPDEALEKAKTAPAAEKALLNQLAGLGWGPIQIYFRLSPDQQAALRAGERLVFSEEPKPGELPLPPDLAHGVLQCIRGWRIIQGDDGMRLTPDRTDPRAVSLTAMEGVRAKVSVVIYQSELGVSSLGGQSGAFAAGFGTMDGGGPQASGASPTTLHPDNAAVNARLSHDAALRALVTVEPDASPAKASGDEAGSAAATGVRVPATRADLASGNPKVTSADALEALHRASGMPLVSDYYTRLYPPEAVTAHGRPLFEALNQLADTMRLRWNRSDGWLQFRSTSFYDDRLKEVPNRLLSRWSASRRAHGALTLDDLVEIAGLTDAQLNGADMAEGAKETWGLAEWELARGWPTRTALRYLAGLTPSQRQEAMSPAGLPFTRMSLPQQQQFMAEAFHGDERPLQSFEELAGAALRVDYTVPGSFEWRTTGPAWLQWVVPLDPGHPDRRVLMPPMRGRTKEAALEAARRLDPALREAAVQALRSNDPRSAANVLADESEIVPTRLQLTVVYIPGLSNRRGLRILRPEQDLLSAPGG